MLSDGITFSRMFFSVLMLSLSTASRAFWTLYVLCGATDVLDGFVARKLREESERGAVLDSAADLLFALACAAKILPSLSLPLWIWLWIALIAVVKIPAIVAKSKKRRKLSV